MGPLVWVRSAQLFRCTIVSIQSFIFLWLVTKIRPRLKRGYLRVCNHNRSHQTLVEVKRHILNHFLNFSWLCNSILTVSDFSPNNEWPLRGCNNSFENKLFSWNFFHFKVAKVFWTKIFFDVDWISFVNRNRFIIRKSQNRNFNNSVQKNWSLSADFCNKSIKLKPVWGEKTGLYETNNGALK